MTWWLIGLAWAGVPDDLVIRPFAATAVGLARFGAWQASQGAAPRPAPCRVLAMPGVSLCFRVWEGSRRRWVTEADLAAWSATPAELYERVRADCVESIRHAIVRTVRGTTSRYLELIDGDGRAVLGLVCPTVVAARAKELGVTTSRFRAALPTEDVLLVWPEGDPDLDRIMAVGVREIHERHAHPLTPHILSYDGGRFAPFGRAVPSVPKSH